MSLRGGGQGVAAEHGGGPGWSRLAKLGLTSDKITIDEAKWLFFQMGVGVALMWVPPLAKKKEHGWSKGPFCGILTHIYIDIHTSTNSRSSFLLWSPVPRTALAGQV